MRLLAGSGYPSPRPFLFESDPAVLGAPFLIMERVSGGPLFSTRGFARAFKTFSLGFTAFVHAQARLHRMGAADFRMDGIPSAYRAAGCAVESPLLERLLAIIAERVENGPLPGLADALDRLRAMAPRFRDAPAAPVHMDYHPQNVIVSGPRVTGVIDWVNADRGDRHLCAATTAVILASSAMEHPRWMRENAAGNTLRWLFASMYVPLYHALAPMEWERFHYCQAVAALLRLSMFGMMRVRGPEAAGFRPEAIENVTPSVVRILSRYAARKSGVPVSIEAG
jgi:aminoglycoside phosphotransferase (APT) family kinase protein